MRFAVISDLHGNLAATRAVLADIESVTPAVERTVHAGDIVGHAAHPNQVVALLRDHRIDGVMGNYDRAVASPSSLTGADYATQAAQTADYAAVRWTRENLSAENLEFVRKLPHELRLLQTAAGRTGVKVEKHDDAVREFRRSFFLGGMLSGNKRMRALNAKRVMLVHGSPRDMTEYIFPDTAQSVFESIARSAQAEVVIFGHAQVGFQRMIAGTAFIGVGSVGQARSGQGIAEYAVLEIVGPEIEVEFRSVTYDVEPEARAIEMSGLPASLATTLREGPFVSR